MAFNVRLISPWRQTDLVVGDFRFSPTIPSESADALLCEWAPHEELLQFGGPKAWYCCEPSTHGDFMTPAWQRIRSQLREDEFFHHAAPDGWRVPHITIDRETEPNLGRNRLKKGIAVISNIGPPPWKRNRHMRTRIRLATHPLVDLFGKKEAWATFRSSTFSRQRPPANYRGEISGLWTSTERFARLAQYHANVCLENASEPFYFTEKFVGAVQAGCVPIYRAHPTVRDTFLRGAQWVDPTDFDDDPETTIRHALDLSGDDVREANALWLQSEIVQATRCDAVFHRIGLLLRGKSSSANGARDHSEQPARLPTKGGR